MLAVLSLEDGLRVRCLIFKRKLLLGGMVVHAFGPTLGRQRQASSADLRTAGLHSETLSQKSKRINLKFIFLAFIVNEKFCLEKS